MSLVYPELACAGLDLQRAQARIATLNSDLQNIDKKRAARVNYTRRGADWQRHALRKLDAEAAPLAAERARLQEVVDTITATMQPPAGLPAVRVT